MITGSASEIDVLMMCDCYRPDYWQVNGVPENACREFFQGGTCTLYTSFCKPLSGIDHCKDFVNTSVCITNGTTDYSLGSYNNLVNPFVSFSK